MFLYLVLCLLATCAFPPGQAQAQTRKECYYCKLRVYSRCFIPGPSSTVCADDYSCGNVRYLIGAENIFSTTGCTANSECNRTGLLTGILRDYSYNATCCISNYCNGGYLINAPYFTILASLGIFFFNVLS